MCGIVAISAPDARRYPMAVTLQATRHRGPDDQDSYISPSGDCALGQNRLAIIDLSAAGHQPMWDHSGRYVITYNGETYNFRELRAQLEVRHGAIAWRGGSDTEVVIEGFAREGIAFLDRLNGIFAMAIYDSVERVMHVLRDPLGIKPLIATEQNGGAFFCSELKGLLALPKLARTLRRESLAEQLTFMYVPEPHTRYREFHKVEPGVCLSYRAGKLVARTPLFAWLDGADPIVGEAEAIEALQDGLAKAVKRQVVADVPVSLMLSGGLDSSAVAEQVARSGANIHDAYTIAYSAADRNLDAQSDDLHYARIMAARLGIELKVINAGADFLDLLPELSPFMEDGFSDPAAINTYLICAGARAQGIKVMLSGQGADELLGGYRRYVAERALQRLPRPVRGVLSLASGVLPANLPGRFNALNRRLRRFAELAAQSPRARILGMNSWTSPATVEALFAAPLASQPGDQFQALLESIERADCVDTLMAIDRRYDLLSLNLTYTDRMSMAVGVEARVPFLDFDLVRVMNAIPASLKVKGGQGKYIFKKAMEPYLPREVIYRSKAGFGLPIRAWMGTSDALLDRYLNRARIEAQGIFNADTIERIRREQAAGAADHASTLLTLLVQQIGLDEDVGSSGALRGQPPGEMSIVTAPKQEVKDFWNVASCGEELYLASEDEAGYRAEAEARYQLEPYILPFADFEAAAGKRVLEIGVGLGADHQRFAEAGAELSGIDLTERAIAHTGRRFAALGLRSSLATGDAEKLDFPDESFDIVYSWGVLHHSPDTPRAIAEVHRVLKPGGEARIMIYHKWSLIGLMLWGRYALARLRPWMSLRHVYANYLESPGTKAYSYGEARELFAMFHHAEITTVLTHADLLESEAGQRHRSPLLNLAKKLWPRPLLKLLFPRAGLFMLIKATKKMSICSNCVMDTSDPKISFDANGVCDHCRTFYGHTLPNWHTDERGERALTAMVERIRKAGKGKEFDCIIGMSGGIDSSYLTYVAKEKLGLRPLVFHVDAGWNSQIAVNNIEKIVDGLGLELYTEVINWEEMKDLQLAFFKSGVSHIDAPQDHAFFATMYKFAVKYGVKHILTGANLSTECVRNPVDWMYYQSDSTQLRDIHARFGTRPLKTFPITSILWHKLYLPLFKRIKVEKPLNHVPYVKEEAVRLLSERFGWQPYPQKHFESRLTRFYEGYWLPRKFGYDTRRVQFSSLILTGQMSREEALEKLKQPPYDEATIHQDFEFVATKLGISVAELQSYMDAPNRSYRDYRNQAWIYNIGANVMKALRLEVGGKR